MLLRTLGLVLVVVFGFVGCGPSAAQIKTARTARYNVSAAEAFQASVAVLADNDYKVEKADPIAGRAQTKPRWYEADGTYLDKGKIKRDRALNGSILFGIEVVVVADGDAFRVDVIPHAIQHRSGGVPYPMLRDDPAMPGWAIGKVENVYLAIYDRLKPHAVVEGGGAAPGRQRAER